MKVVYKIGEGGFFAGHEEMSSVPPGCTDKKPMIDNGDGTFTGFYKAKWDGEKWIEGATQLEIEAITNAPKTPTEEERIAALEEALLLLMMEG